MLHLLSGQLVHIHEVIDALPPFERGLMKSGYQLRTRALKLLHEWAQCVYFDVDGLRDIICLSPEFLTQETLAELFNPKFLSASGLVKNGMILNKHFYTLWSDQGVVPKESVPKLLLLMQQLRMSFTRSEIGKSFEQLTTFVPLLLPDILPSNYEVIWPKVTLSSFPFEKHLIYFFDPLPHEFISQLLASVLQEFYDCTPTALWKSGGVFLSPTFELLVRLESQPDEYEIVIKDQSLQVSKATSSFLKTQLLVVHVRACEEESGFQAMQSVLKMVNKIKESYIGIRFWILARQCPLHDNQCAGFVDLTKLPTCIASEKRLESTTIKRLRIACGLEEGDGLRNCALLTAQPWQARRRTFLKSKFKVSYVFIHYGQFFDFLSNACSNF
jgi:hypothetical protein